MATMTVSKVRRLVNPGRKRKMTAKQIRFFGTKRQKAALRGRRHNASDPKRIRKALAKRDYARASYYAGHAEQRYAKRRVRRRHNVGSILTVFPAGLNPGRKRKRYRSNRGSKRVFIINKGVSMARRRKASHRRVVARRVHRRRRNPVYVRRIKRGSYMYASAPKRHRRRRHNPSMRRHLRRRRNPGFATGTVGKVVGIIGGATVTKLACGFLPNTFQTGILGYLATAIVAFGQGKLVGKITRNAALGTDMQIGGYTYLAIKVLNDFVPSVGSMIGLSGMGLLAPSSFYVPQVPIGGSMTQFITPAGIPVGAPASVGVGRLRRTGRLM